MWLIFYVIKPVKASRFNAFTRVICFFFSCDHRGIRRQVALVAKQRLPERPHVDLVHVRHKQGQREEGRQARREEAVRRGRRPGPRRRRGVFRGRAEVQDHLRSQRSGGSRT